MQRDTVDKHLPVFLYFLSSFCIDAPRLTDAAARGNVKISCRRLGANSRCTISFTKKTLNCSVLCLYFDIETHTKTNKPTSSNANLAT